MLPPVDCMDGLWNDWERAAVESKLRAAIVGSEQTLQAGLERLIAATGADEIIVVTDVWDHAARLDSLRRIAAAASLIDRKRVHAERAFAH
jgi:alkanesulfonate monooxygenase SsuD/methylene tetrahydromethanopterin reductase-like flavin-dependent oxidoreductase (luciferase family)